MTVSSLLREPVSNLAPRQFLGIFVAAVVVGLFTMILIALRGE